MRLVKSFGIFINIVRESDFGYLMKLSRKVIYW